MTMMLMLTHTRCDRRQTFAATGVEGLYQNRRAGQQVQPFTEL
jgi:hypothetical protein